MAAQRGEQVQGGGADAEPGKRTTAVVNERLAGPPDPREAYYVTVQAEAFIGAGKPEGTVMALRDNALPVLTEVTSARTLSRLKAVRTGLRPLAAGSTEIEECCELSAICWYNRYACDPKPALPALERH